MSDFITVCVMSNLGRFHEPMNYADVHEKGILCGSSAGRSFIEGGGGGGGGAACLIEGGCTV